MIIENLIVAAIDSAAVPSTIAGTIRDLAVREGDAIFRVVRLNRLRAEGFLSSDQAVELRSRNEDGAESRSVTVDWVMPTGERKSMPGKVSFISLEVDAINNQVRFWVEFDNPDLLALPGMKVNARIDSAIEPVEP